MIVLSFIPEEVIRIKLFRYFYVALYVWVIFTLSLQGGGSYMTPLAQCLYSHFCCVRARNFKAFLEHSVDIHISCRMWIDCLPLFCLDLQTYYQLLTYYPDILRDTYPWDFCIWCIASYCNLTLFQASKILRT